MDLDKLTRDELITKAVELNIPSCKGKHRAWLLREVKAAVKDAVPDTERPGELTADEARRIKAAGNPQLLGLLRKPDLPEYLSGAIEAELKLREPPPAPPAPPGPVQYLVTKGGPFVVGGMVNELATGSVVSQRTHSLQELKAQGMVLEEIQGTVRMEKDPIGGVRTVIDPCTES